MSQKKNSRLDLNKSFDRERHKHLKIVSSNNVPLELVQENFFEYTDSQSVIGDQILFPDRITNESLKKVIVVKPCNSFPSVY